MTPEAAWIQWCTDSGVTVLEPDVGRPYFLLFRPNAADPTLADFTVGELMGEAVLAFQGGRCRTVELRAVAPGMCPASGAEPPLAVDPTSVPDVTTCDHVKLAFAEGGLVLVCQLCTTTWRSETPAAAKNDALTSASTRVDLDFAKTGGV